MSIILQTSYEDHLVAWLAALAISIHIVESALPTPLPGIKPGLANVVTLTTLCLYGFRLTVWVSMLRVLVGSLIIGTFLSPTFMLSLAGAVASLVALGCALNLSKYFRNWAIGPIGYGVIAALAHMGGQFLVAYQLFIPHPGILSLLPVLLSFALAFGLVSGLIASAVVTEFGEKPCPP